MSDATKPPSQTGLSRSETAALTTQAGSVVSRGLEPLSPSTLASAIEPLALAIEHLRMSRFDPSRMPPDSSRMLRIRTYAVALARTQNLSEREIRAIELAALLSHVGQLAPN